MDALLLALFFGVLAAAAALGLTADSRDGADWAPTRDGLREPRTIGTPRPPGRKSARRRR